MYGIDGETHKALITAVIAVLRAGRLAKAIRLCVRQLWARYESAHRAGRLERTEMPPHP
jgi:hypothetical protein